jgi:hypothetical protein
VALVIVLIILSINAYLLLYPVIPGILWPVLPASILLIPVILVTLYRALLVQKFSTIAVALFQKQIPVPDRAVLPVGPIPVLNAAKPSINAPKGIPN